MRNVIACFGFCIVALASVAGCGQEGLPVTVTDPDLAWRPEKEIVLDCAWLSQEPSEKDARRGGTLNCGPTSLVTAVACMRDYVPEYGEVIDLMNWMDEHIPAYGGVGENNRGSPTDMVQLSTAAEGYYGLLSQEFHLASSRVTLRDLYADLKNGLSVIVGVAGQGINTSDVMKDASFGHAMLIVGMTPTHVVFHDPGPWDASYGRYHEYTIESFQKIWDESGLRFLKE